MTKQEEIPNINCTFGNVIKAKKGIVRVMCKCGQVWVFCKAGKPIFVGGEMWQLNRKR